MLFADVMIASDYAALESGKIIFSAVDMNEAAEPSIFICRMVHSSVVRKFFSELGISGVFVGHEI